MNGRYGVANMPGLEIHLPNRSGGRFVDVYTPVIESLYSQVAWTPHDVAFPADFVAEFAGKVVNIVGYWVVFTNRSDSCRRGGA